MYVGKAPTRICPIPRRALFIVPSMKVHVAALSDDFVEDPFAAVKIGDEAWGGLLCGWTLALLFD